MSVRAWFAILLLINYLLVVGMGCVNRPEDQPELVRIQTTEEGHLYQQCRYMRMDGLESFLVEAMASHLQNASGTPAHHLISVISGINAHYLIATRWQLLPPACIVRNGNTLPFAYQLMVVAGVHSSINPPPWSA